MAAVNTFTLEAQGVGQVWRGLALCVSHKVTLIFVAKIYGLSHGLGRLQWGHICLPGWASSQSLG